MGRFSLAATSLIPAIPAGLLCFFLVSAFLSNAENMSGTLQGVIAGSLLVAAAVIVMPVGILLFGGAKSTAAADKGATATEDDDELGVDDELLADDDDTEQNSLTDDDDDSYAETVAYDSSAELEDVPAADSGDEIDFFDDEEDDDK